MAQIVVRERRFAIGWLKRRRNHAQSLTRIALHLRFPVRAVKGLRTVAGLLLLSGAAFTLILLKKRETR